MLVEVKGITYTDRVTLDYYRGDALALSRTWADLAQAERRRRALQAIQGRDVEGLLDLLTAHLTLYGRSGARTSPHTFSTYRKGLRRFFRATEASGFDLLRPTQDGIMTWLRAREASGVGPQTVRSELACLKALYRALRWAGLDGGEVLSGVSGPRDPTAPWDKRQPYSEAELQALLKAADPQTRALLLLCAHAGLRIGEALSLTWEDLDLPARALTVRSGKGGKSGRVALSETLLRALREYRATLQGASGRLVPVQYVTAAKRLTRLSSAAGVAAKGYHSLRHYSGTRMYRQTGNLDAVARHLRHSLIETTRIYAKFADEDAGKAVGSW